MVVCCASNRSPALIRIVPPRIKSEVAMRSVFARMTAFVALRLIVPPPPSHRVVERTAAYRDGGGGQHHGATRSQNAMSRQR